MILDVRVEEQYQGPMDLLLYLIKRDEIDIHDIPVARLTSEFLKEMEAMGTIDVEAAAEFAALASMLMEIKSRMLLPPEETAEEGDEEEVAIDPRAGLVEALLEYKRFKEAAGELDELWELQQKRFFRRAPETIADETAGDAAIDANPYELFAAFARLMRETLAQTEATTIVSTEIRTEDCIDAITARLAREGRVAFSQLLSAAPTAHEMVVYFVAVLELIRLRRVHAYQSADFTEIYLEEQLAPVRLLDLPARFGRSPGSGGRRGGAVILAFPLPVTNAPAAGRRTGPPAFLTAAPRPASSGGTTRGAEQPCFPEARRRAAGARRLRKGITANPFALF